VPRLSTEKSGTPEQSKQIPTTRRGGRSKKQKETVRKRGLARGGTPERGNYIDSGPQKKQEQDLEGKHQKMKITKRGERKKTAR